MQREGRAEDALCQQLVDPEQPFLLVAVWGLGQDGKQLWVAGVAQLPVMRQQGRTERPTQLLAEPSADSDRTARAQISLLQPHAPQSHLRNADTLARVTGLTGLKAGSEPRPWPCAARSQPILWAGVSLHLGACVRGGHCLCPG